MSAGRWSPPEHCPPSAALSGDGRVLRLRDPHVEVPRLSPAPMLQTDRSGYPVPVAVVEELRGRADNLVGMKVSDAPIERVKP